MRGGVGVVVTVAGTTLAGGAVTGDGGRHWMTRGTELPGLTQSAEPEQVAAVS